jgi:hypothetical protein
MTMSKSVSLARAFRLILLLGVVWLSAGCEKELGFATKALFDLTGNPQQDLFALPYPNNIRVRDDGTIDLARLSRDQPTLIQDYLDRVITNRLGGFACNGAVFFRFDGALAPSSLPAMPRDSTEPDSSVLMVDIEPSSADFGKRVPVQVRFVEKGDRYIGDNYLSVLPVPGFVLAPETTYAVLVRNTARNADRALPLSGGDDFPALLRSNPPSEDRLKRAYELYEPLRRYLGQANITDVAVATIFTTGDPTRIVRLGRQVILEQAPPKPVTLELVAENERYYELEGTYQAPNFQQGTSPYLIPADGGDIEIGVDKRPVIARSETLRFALTLPKGTPPRGGFPVVLYSHGTGGDYRTFIRNGVASDLAAVRDDSGAMIGQLAVLGIDQVVHGTRAPAGTSVDLAFFNALNPAALVSNVLQAALDNFSLRQMVSMLALTRIAWRAGSGQTGELDLSAAKLDTSRVLFFGPFARWSDRAALYRLRPGPDGRGLVGGGGGHAPGAFAEETSRGYPRRARAAFARGAR